MTEPTSLKHVLAEHILKSGPLSVHDFMEMALTHPEFGYYVTGNPIGRNGDFITAPEITQIFGELIGLWVAQVWMDMGAPSPIHLVELGPGRGTLMSDLLRTVRQAVPELFASAEVHLVEISPCLQDVQRLALQDYAVQSISWHRNLEDLPAGPMIALGNEFLDALPIRQYFRSHDGWYERHVAEGVDGAGTLGFCLAETCADLALPDAIAKATVESFYEVRPGADKIAGFFSDRFSDQPGAALFIDYGHGKTSLGDTFQAVKDHKPQHVLIAPGEADLTAHVDFEAFTKAAKGLGVTPVQDQGRFLNQLGIEARLESLSKTATPAQSQDLLSSYKRLTDNDQMGSLFKAVALYSPGLTQPPGFDDRAETE